MPRSRWTLVLVPHDNERVRTFQVSARAIRATMFGVGGALLLLGAFSVGFFIQQGHDLRNAALRRENRLLSAEVRGMRSRMAMLEGSIDSLAQRGNTYRAVAGLPNLDSAALESVRMAQAGAAVAPSALLAVNPRLARQVGTTETDLSTLMRRTSLLHGSLDQAIRTLTGNRERLASLPSILPSNGPLTSLFTRNRRHPVLGVTRPHKGIDIAAPYGEPIVAPAKGVVRFAGNRNNGYGNMVEIDHGYGYVTRFAHASALTVKPGDVVRRGQRIARVGATGLVSGPNLHYEVEFKGNQVDPLNFIIGDQIPD